MEPLLNPPPAWPALPSRRLRWTAAAMRVLLWLVAGAWLLFALGALFIVVTLLLPKGVVGLWGQIKARSQAKKARAPT